MNLSGGKCEPIKKKIYHKKMLCWWIVRGESVGADRYATSMLDFFFSVCRFCAFLISLWLNTLLTDSLIRLRLCALWAY